MHDRNDFITEGLICRTTLRGVLGESRMNRQRQANGTPIRAISATIRGQLRNSWRHERKPDGGEFGIRT